MALNIAITSKYNPFTYEDYIKPLEGYWEDYEKQEAALDQLGTDVATLRPIIENMGEGEEKTKYTNWLNSLEQQAGNLQSNGLTAENRKALRELKTNYASLMPRLALAEEARRKAAADWMAERNSGKYFTDDNLPQELQNVNNFLDGNIPYYSKGISKDDVSKEALSVAKAFSSRVFTDPTITKDTQAGVDFIKQVEERGYNANIEDIQNDELLSPILESLYGEYGIDKNATDARSRSIRDHIAKEFWKGLVYEKQTNYQQYNPTKTDRDFTTIGKLPNGNTVIRSGNKHFEVDPRGVVVGEIGTSKDDLTISEKRQIEDNNIYLRNTVDGFDNWAYRNVGNINRVGEADERGLNTPIELYRAYKSSVLNYDEVKKSKRVQIMTGNEDVWFAKARKNKGEDTEGFDSARRLDNTIFLGIGSTIGGRYGESGELFGDNHMRLIDADVLLEYIDKESSISDKVSLLQDIYRNTDKSVRTSVGTKVVAAFKKILLDNIYKNEDGSLNVDKIAPFYYNNWFIFNGVLDSLPSTLAKQIMEAVYATPASSEASTSQQQPGKSSDDED